jgi:hypothetical protein
MYSIFDLNTMELVAQTRNHTILQNLMDTFEREGKIVYFLGW